MSKIVVFIFMLLPVCLLAQRSLLLNGFVVGENSLPVDYATIGLYEMADSSIIAGAISDDAGYFEIRVKLDKEPSQPALKISFIGFETLVLPLSLDNNHSDVGKLILKISSEVIEGVEIVSQRPQYIRKADRLIVNLKDNSALISGKSAIETLQYVPGIILDGRENIMLNGQSGVQVLVDGEELMLDGIQLQNYLNSLSAENISSIELITNPSSKYSAENKAGILNIITKKQSTDGVNGNVFGTFAMGKFDHYRSGASLNIKKKKLRIYSGYTFSSRLFLSEQTKERNFSSLDNPTVFKGASKDEARNVMHFLNGGMSYDINDRHSFGVKIDGTLLEYRNPYLDSTSVFTGNDILLDSSFTTDNNTDGPYRSVNASLSYNWEIDTLGKSMSFLSSFANISDLSRSDLNLSFYDSGGSISVPVQRLKLLNEGAFKIISEKLDFYLPTKKSNVEFETGLKYSYVLTDSRFDFFDNNDGLELVPERSSAFDFDEHIIAAYLTSGFSLKDTWSIQLGLRGEQTISKGGTNNVSAKRSYFDIFPTAFISKTFKKEGHSMSLSYGRRIERPGFSSLTNLAIFRGPYSIIAGNTSLVPEYINELEVSYSINSNSISAGYARSKNVITEFSEQDDSSGVVVITPENLDHQNYYYLSLFMPIYVKEIWSLNINSTYYFNQFVSEFESGLFDSKQHTFYLTLNSELYLPKKFTLSAYYSYNSPTNRGIQRFEGQHKLNMGISKQLLNDKLTIGVVVSDIFKTQRDNFTTVFENQVAKSYQTYDSRKFNLSVSYRFSRGQGFRGRGNDFGNDGELNRTY